MIDRQQANLAKATAVYCFRNTGIENIHAGKIPVTLAGDFSDVAVIDADGHKIPWNEVSRITDDEMKELMTTAVDRLYDVLSNVGTPALEKILNYSLRHARAWNDPKETVRK